MYWNEILSQNERDEMLEMLSDKQRTFINEYLKRGRRTIFANVLAREKASSVEEASIEEVASQWELLDYIDAGPNWQSTSELRCECGRPLRYQYIVQNRETGELRKFGIKHFEEHIGIPPHLVKDIVKGVESIDFEMDEILLKIENAWTLEEEGIFSIPPSVEVPEDLLEHLDNDVPLLARQVRRLKERIAEYLREEKRKQLEAKQTEKEKLVQQQKEIIAERRKAIAEKMGWGKKNGMVNEIPLDKELQLGVLVFLDRLKSTTFSASEVCTNLVTYHGASKETYSSGQLRIYATVCIFLESLVRENKLELVEKQGVTDRVYKVIGSGLYGERAGKEQIIQGELF